MQRTPSPTLLLLLAILLAMSACTRVEMVRTSPLELPTGSLAATRDDGGWWSIAFHVAWDRDEPPDWSLDTLLADQVCAPALAAFRPRIELWRFHRRAADDNVGHRFSLLVYGDASTAESLYARVRESSMLEWLESDHRIASVTLEKLEPPRPMPIAHSSDANWPVEIQASWPWYIMGVSQTWLSLIDQVKAAEPFDESTGDALLEYYAGVNARVTTLWRNYGQHVYLHHLNALFGYAPIVIRETNLKRF